MKQIKEFVSKNGLILWCIFVFILAAGVRFYAISLKQDLFIDEAATTAISSYNKYWIHKFDTEVEFSGNDVIQMNYRMNPTFKGMLNDIKNLYIDNRDTPHTNFYYSIYRAWFFGVQDFDIRNTINRGCALNLVFFSISFFLMYKLLRRFFARSALVPFGLFAAFMNTGAISQTIFLRPYELQSTLFVLVVYVFVKCADSLREDNFAFTVKNFFTLAFPIALTFLSGYYAPVFVFFFAAYLLVYAVRKKNYRAVWFLAGVGIASIILTVILYPNYFCGFLGYRGVEAAKQCKICELFVYKFYRYFPIIYLQHLFNLSLLAVLFVFWIVIRKHKLINEYSKLILVIFTFSFLWSVVITYIAPYKVLRYIMPVFPITAIIFAYAGGFFKDKRLYITAVCSVFILNLYVAFASFKSPEMRKYIPIPSKVDFLKNTNSEKYLFRQNPNLPVAIVEYDIYIDHITNSSLYPYFLDNQVYIFYRISQLNEIEYNHFYLIVPEYNVDLMNMDDRYIRLNTQECTQYYMCYEYKKI